MILSSFLCTFLLSGLSSNAPFTYVACYKPALTLCSQQSDVDRAKRKHRDPRQTLADLGLPENLHIVGRLDRDSEGLLLLTDDGQFTARVLSEACQKEYWAFVNGGTPSDENMNEMRQGGLVIRGAKTQPPVSVNLLEHADRDGLGLPEAVPGMNRGTAWLKVVLKEGRNRQVRKITGCAGHKTARLCRVAVGSFRLEDHQDLLEPGSWKHIQKEDVITG
jgi:23S rRNA pseudouridine2457 synthase